MAGEAMTSPTKSRKAARDEEISALRREVADLRRRQDANADILRAIVAAPGQAEKTLQMIVETADRLFRARTSIIALVEDGCFREAAVAGPQASEFAGRLTGLPVDTSTAIGTAVIDQRVVHVDDARELSQDIENTLGRSRRPPPRTIIMAPMLVNGAAVGAIGVSRLRRSNFSRADISLLQSFADQAVIAVENARLLAELREALANQTASSDILRTIAEAPADAHRALDAIADATARLFGAQGADIRVLDGDLLPQVGSSGPVGKVLRDAVGARRVSPDWLPGATVLKSRQIHIPDIDNPEPDKADWPGWAPLRTVGIRTTAGTPLMREGQAIGALMAMRTGPKPFTDRELAQLRNFADQAVIAIENARLLAELRESLDRQTATADILRVIASTPSDPERELDIISDTARRMFNASNVHLRRLDGDVLHAVSTSSLNPLPETLPDVPLDWTMQAGQCVRENRQVHVNDLSSDVDWEGAPASRLSVQTGVRSQAVTPMTQDGKAIGVMIVSRNEVRPFSPSELELMRGFADQAVIAIENARLLRELHQSLDRQTATSEVLSTIASAPSEVSLSLDKICQAALRLFGAASVNVVQRDGDDVRATGAAGPAATYMLNEDPAIPMAGTLPGTAITEGRLVQIVDLEDLADPARHMSNLRVDFLRRAGIRTLVAAPLMRGGEPIGALVVHRNHVKRFTDDELSLLQSFAEQAVIAIENARLLSELRNSLEHQTASAEVLGVISASPGDLEPVFETMLVNAMRICEAQCGFIYRVEAGEMHLMAESDLPPPYAEYRRSHPHSGGALNQMLKTLKPIHVIDARESEGYLARNPDTVAGVELGGARTVLYVPMIRDGEIIGIINVFRREVRPFDANQLALLENFAKQAVIAIENARLLDELRSRQAELRVTFDNMGDGVVMFDADLRLAAWNHNLQQILEIPNSFFSEPKTYRDYVTYMIERGEFSPERAAQLVREDEVATGEERFERTRQNGQVIEVRRNPVPGGGFVLIFSDITERKRAEEQVRAARDAAERALVELRAAQANLVQAEKMASLGQLTAGIAHEIKNPLNFVNNFAGLSVELLDELKEAQEAAIAALDADKRAEIEEIAGMLTSNLEKIAAHGKRADGIVKSMLAHSRGGASDRQEANLNALVEEALNLAYHGARAQDQSFNIALERALDPEIGPIEVVPQELMRVFLNLFGNGFYAANKRFKEGEDGAFSPTLRVTTREGDGEVEICIRDNGVGIPADHLPRLFEPFFTTKPTGEGTGLGLSISYEIVTRQHGGQITVESEPGAYTEFTVTIPRRA